MKQYVVDAFTDKIFSGNQAAVCVLEDWLSDELMQNIAKENNFSETAFTVKKGNIYKLRWFTPSDEIDLCGHATLAAAFIIHKFYDSNIEDIIFRTMSGDLFVKFEKKQDEDRTLGIIFPLNLHITNSIKFTFNGQNNIYHQIAGHTYAELTDL